ncbi:MAG: prolyl oligopeptidase family serine peptidase [Anaerolineae bacterium]|nr:prolyl oligopeptidase family serine peptidase [Anaerolineae bacterium]
MMTEPTTILASETHTMDSEHTGRTYRITVSLPLGYAKSPDESWPFNNTPAQWPVVYVLDGNWYAGMITDMIRPTAWCGRTTDAIVVGIGYPQDQDPIAAFRESFTRRDFDLTPIRDEAVEKSMTQSHQRPVPNGDAGNFLKFIQNEVIPFIEKNYRADPSKRILLGHSYGGLFALFAMFESPELFDTLVIGSPTLSYGDRFTFQQEEAFAKAHKTLPAKVYLFAAELEEAMDDTTLTDTLRMAAILQGRHYEDFSLVKHVFLDQNHCEVAAPGFQWGLKSALQR